MLYGRVSISNNFKIEASWKETKIPDEKKIEIPGGAKMFVQIEAVPEADLFYLRVEKSSTISCQQQGIGSIYLSPHVEMGLKIVYAMYWRVILYTVSL